MRDILGSIGLGIKHDHAQGIAVLAGHQVGNGGLKVGAIEVGLGERGTVPAVAVEDAVVIFGRDPE